MRYARVLALVLALSFAVSSEGFRLKRGGSPNVAVGFHRSTGGPSMVQDAAGFASAVVEEDEGVGEEDLKEQDVDEEHEVEWGDEEQDEKETEEESSFVEGEVGEDHDEEVDDEENDKQEAEEESSFVEQKLKDRFNASASAQVGKCHSWCATDKAKQGHRHCAPGDMADQCGSCSYCSGACKSWCKSDRSNQGHRHCAPGDMASSCGGCSYCKSPSPERRRRTTSPRRRQSTGGGGSVNVKILTYNLFWWNLYGRRGGNGRSASKLIVRNNNPSYDFMGFQECDDVSRVMRDGSLTSQYGTLNGGHALAIAYRKSRWSLLSSGKRDVGKDRHDQYYGHRGVHWGRFEHKQSGKTVFFMNFHGPLPVGTGGEYGGTKTAQNIAAVLREKAKSADTKLMVGDFNHGAGTSLIKELERHLKKVYTGKSFGGVDNVFSSGGSVTSKRNLGNGGSDHDALDVTIKV